MDNTRERNTVQREIITAAVKKLKIHATADEIFELIAKEHPAVSRSTVYRNLQRLCKKGELRKREMPGQADVYDSICTNHYHVKCVKCGGIFDVDMDYINDLERCIKDTHDFTFISHDIIFSGICPNCNKKK